MFGKIAAFEMRYQLRNPVFWVALVIFFLLTFGATASTDIQIGSGGNVNVNSPFAIAQVQLILTLFFMFVTTAFVANVIVRDDESGFGPMVRSTRVGKFSYLIGRFTGATLTAMLAFAVVPFALFLGSNMPWLDPETIGPNRPEYYIVPFLLFALPNIFMTCALFFAVATVTRSMMYSYVAVVLFLVLYITLVAIGQGQPELREFIKLAEPFGIAAFGLETRYWTAADSNTMTAPLTAALITNRAIWLGIGLAALAFALWRFRLADKGVSARKARRQAKKQAKLAAIAPQTVATLPDLDQDGSAWPRLVARTKFEMGQVLRSPAFFVLMLVGLFNATGALYFGNEIYGTPARPVTFSMIGPLMGTFAIIPLIIAIYYGGELVWRDRDRKMNEIIDASPVPGWSYMVPKTLAVAFVLFSALLISGVAAMLIQLARGYTDLEIGKYLTWYVVPGAVDMVTLAILAVFIQALSPNKYIGWGTMVVYLVGTLVLGNLGFDHPLYFFGSGAPNPVFSDLNGNALNGQAAWAIRLYWIAVAVIWAALAHLLWRRGTETRLMPRLKRLPRRLVGPTGVVIGAAAVATAASGAYVYNNTNVLNTYQTQDDVEAQQAAYEKKYLQYETLVQPTVTEMTLVADLYPQEKRAVFSGTYRLENDKDVPIEDLHVRFSDQFIDVLELEIDGAELVEEDDEFQYRIYRFAEPLAPGAQAQLRYKTRRWQRGFRAGGNDSRLVRNGTFLSNNEFAPQIGMNRQGLLTDRQTRREYGLEPELRPAKLEDDSARARNYVGNAPWVTSDITVSTVADQTPVAPGSKVADETANGRRTARFVADSPILGLFSIQSARYEVAERLADGVNLQVYHHPAHDFNVDRMLDALETSLGYYKENFGPYQFDYARIIEFPAYASFAQAFAGTMPYSEGIGFIANNADPEDIDYVSYITAHEVAHQYWAHQIISADQQGGTVLVETMAQYSALMVMKQTYGEDQMRRFLKFELDNYLNARGSEAIEELPLERVENQGYIHYRKGALVMYLLQERLGEDRMNAMLAQLIEKYRFKGAPYAQSTDLVNGLLSLARDDAERELVEDLFKRITLYDLKADEAVVRELPDGRFETRIRIAARKFYADGRGEENEAPLDDEISVGVFDEQLGDGAFDERNVLYLKRHRIVSGEQVVRVVTDRRPTYAGVDPYNFYIDRNSDDNLTETS